MTDSNMHETATDTADICVLLVFAPGGVPSGSKSDLRVCSRRVTTKC